MNNYQPYLSLVATSRNDDHGGDPLTRTQIFINTLALQCEKYKLPAELVLVDWNPVADRPGLAAVLELPTQNNYFRSRVITVPAIVHQKIKYSDKLSLFQMIAKNVGIRRANGKFILATNIDIIFSDELIQFIAEQKLDASRQYRVDRYDIQSGLSKNYSLDQTLQYAWSHLIRTHRRYQPGKLIQKLYGQDRFNRECHPDLNTNYSDEKLRVKHEDGIWQLQPDRKADMGYIHTNACGDFTLLSREGWYAIRGYPEFEAFSFNIDSMGVISAHYAGYTEVALLPPYVCFHIEHGIGSGWTPEGESKLFSRLRQSEILNPEWPVLRPLINEMREKSIALEFNHAGWGMAEFELPEQNIGDRDPIPSNIIDQLAVYVGARDVTAIKPAYDLDRLTLFHERRALAKLGLNIGSRLEKVQILLPDQNGSYKEENSMSQEMLFIKNTTLLFKLDKYPHQYPLRFDPCESRGTIEIQSVKIKENQSGKTIYTIDNNNGHLLKVSGTASMPTRIVQPQRGVEQKNPSVSTISANQSGLAQKIKRTLLSQSSAISFVKQYLPVEMKFRLKVLLFGQETVNLPVLKASAVEPTTIRITSNGSDPQIYFPPILEEIDFPVTVTIEMRFTPLAAF